MKHYLVKFTFLLVLCGSLFTIHLPLEFSPICFLNPVKEQPHTPAVIWSPFMLPWNDSTPTASDMSWLLDPPAGKHGFLEVGEDGHFYFEDGLLARFWGTNLCWDFCFPNYSDAAVIASRLAKFGFNLVRLHKFDSFFNTTYNIFVNSTQNTREIDWARVDRMDYLFSQLKQRGIYVDLNLHAERRFTTGDGVVFADEIPWMSKYVSLFNETMIDLQKEFALAVLNHTNPYTGLRYLEDPAIVMVDVTNENSMFLGFISDNLNGPVIGGGEWHEHYDIPKYYSQDLDLRWNAYLRKKYPDRTSLESVWSIGEAPLEPPNLVQNGNFESDLSHWNLTGDNGRASSHWSNDDPAVPPGLALINITNPNPNWWYGSLRFRQPGISFINDSWYTISFWAKSTHNRTISVSILKGGQHRAKWEFIVGSSWQRYFWTFKVNNDIGDEIAFDLSHAEAREQPTLYFLDDVKLFKGGVLGLQSFEDPWTNNVTRMTYSTRYSYTDTRFADLVNFYSNIEVNYSRSLRDYLTAIGLRVPMDMTNGYYSLAGFIGQLEMDYMDTHGYWDPEYLKEDNWMKPMFTTIKGGTIPGLVLSSFVSKPVSVSEYNHLFPQPGHFECPIMIAGYARLQDWDAIMLFDYHGKHRLDLEYLPHGNRYSIDRNVAILSQLPAAANIFLRGDANPAFETLLLNYSLTEAYNHTKYYGMYNTTIFEPRDFDARQVLIHKVRRNFVDTSIPQELDPVGVPLPFVSDNGELTLDGVQGYFTLNTPKTQSILGYLSNNTVALPNLREDVTNSLAALSLTSLTQDSICSSSHLLLAAISEVRNTGMTLNPNAPPDRDHWGGPPMITQIVQGTISIILDNSALPLHIYSLAATGERLNELTYGIGSITETHMEIVFQIGQDNTTWYEIFRGSIPTAQIVPPEPLTVSPGQLVTLSGHGEYNGSTDPSLIQEYRWGLSNTSYPTQTYVIIASEQSLTLQLNQEGPYTVYFKLKGPNGVWSAVSTIQVLVTSSSGTSEFSGTFSTQISPTAPTEALTVSIITLTLIIFVVYRKIYLKKGKKTL
ncbi:MAG: carbohydrate binding domain-containing protein [Candidatus Hodarchaeota archaeon]